MSRRCELTGKAVQAGNKVSHSNRKTRTRFLPNLVQVTLISDTLERAVRLRISAAALRSVEHRGGLDAFLTKARDAELSTATAALKREIAKKHAELKPRPPEPPPPVGEQRRGERPLFSPFRAPGRPPRATALRRPRVDSPRASASFGSIHDPPTQATLGSLR